MCRLFFLLLLVTSITCYAQQEVKLPPEVLIEKCGSYPPYYGYKFTQEEIDALLEQWLPLHQAWSAEIELLLKTSFDFNEDIFDKNQKIIHYSKHSQDLRKINLCGAYLAKLDLSNTDLSKINFISAQFKQANLTGSDLEHANLTDSDLEKANLTNASLWLTNLADANLERANLTNISWKGYDPLDLSYNVGKTNFNNAVLRYANLTRAFLFSANLTDADLDYANLTDADLYNANLTNGSLYKANLTNASLKLTDLSDTALYQANLTNSVLNQTDLSKVAFNTTNFNQCKFFPSPESIANLDISEFSSFILFKQDRFFSHVNYYHEEAKEIAPAMVVLRNQYRQKGMRESERIVTNLIQTRIEQANLEDPDIWKQLNGWLSKIFFNWTTGYGLEPERVLNILIASIGFFAFIYWLALRFDSKHNQFEIIWESKAQTSNTRRGVLLGKQGYHDMCYPLRLKRTKKGWRNWFYFELKVIRISIYFSAISAFSIGWQQYNIGDWIRQLQTRDTNLHIHKGWIRSIAGFQSLLGLYLLVIWMLTQFGRPFD